MGAAARRVRRVRLRAPRGDLVRRGALLLEDALHTASVPGGDGGRLLLVRSLDVGRIRAGAPPSALALEIERRLGEAERAAVPAEDSAAAAAPAVWFRDAAEAAAALAVRLARGGAADAWFWRPAVRGWVPGTPAAEGIRLALRAAAETPAGPAAVAEVLRRALAAGAADRVAECVTPAHAAALLALSGWRVPPRPRAPDGRSAGAALPASPQTGAGPAAGEASASRERPAPGEAPLDALPAGWRALVERWVGEWGEGDVRSVWLACTALLVAHPARAADPALPGRAMEVAAAAARRVDRSAPVSRSPSSVLPPLSGEEGARGARERAGEHPAAGDAAAGAADGPASASASPFRGRRVASRRGEGAPAGRPPPEARYGPARAQGLSPRGKGAREAGEGAPVRTPAAPRGEIPSAERDAAAPRSAACGLFFLIPGMQALGMDGHLAAHPHLLEAELPTRVLLRAAVRTGVAPRDPAFLALALADAGEPGRVLPFAAPEAWRRLLSGGGETVEHAESGGAVATLDASGRLLLSLARGSGGSARDLARVVDAWVAALRRYCRRHARMGLCALVRRAGRVAATRTHLDVALPLDAADLRVRAAGLDRDPGWVPWLGRVVAFHYTD